MDPTPALYAVYTVVNTHILVHFGAPVELWSPQIVWTNVGQKLDISCFLTNFGQMSENVLGTVIGQILDEIGLGQNLDKSLDKLFSY